MYSKLDQTSRTAKEPTKKRKPDSEKSYKELRKKCVSLFAKCVKLKWSIGNFCQCITCGRWLPINEIDCGHYLSVKYQEMEFEFDNARPQCPVPCNRMNYGEQEIFREKLVEQIGEVRVLRIEAAKPIP